LQKVEPIKEQYQVKVSLDGGINSKNISLICQKPVSEVYVGSGLLEQKDPASEYKKLVLSCQR
jgi:3-keto-L-gulonate-6-phosphate decarboxylase